MGKCAEQLISHLVHYEDEFLQKIVASETTVIDPKKPTHRSEQIEKVCQRIVAGILIGCTLTQRLTSDLQSGLPDELNSR